MNAEKESKNGNEALTKKKNGEKEVDVQAEAEREQ